MTVAHHVNPRITCPAAGRLTSLARSHGSYRAARENGCTCPGPGQDSYAAYKAQQATRKRDKRAGKVTAPDFWSPAVPEPVHDGGDLERELYARRDLACTDEDLNLFFPVGRGQHAAAQTAAAKRVCVSCPALDLCREVMLARVDDYGVAAAMDPEERRRARAERGAHR